MPTPLIAQLGFSSGAMLAWGLAAAIPLAIHLLRKHRRQSIPWAAMQLLQRVIEQQSNRSRLQQLILLLVRMLVLALLAVALARPFWKDLAEEPGKVVARPSKLWILVMDTSYSMGYRTAGQSRMERAKQLASQLISNSPQGDAFALVALDDPSRPVIGTATFDAQSTLAEIQRLTETACGCNLDSAIAIASDIAADCKSDSRLPQDIELVIYSDLGDDAWQTAVDGEVAKSLARVRQVANLTVESFADSSAVNVAIESIAPTTYRPVVGNPFAVEVSVSSYGASVKNLPLQLELDGQVVASQTIDIDADQKKEFRFQAVVQSVGSSVLSAMIPSDNLSVDNRFDAVVEASAGNRVLIVESRESSSNPWKLALRPMSAAAGVEDARVREVSEVSWPTMQLRDWNIVLFDDVAIDAMHINRLKSYLDSGGAVVFAWGRRSAQAVSAISKDRSSAESELLSSFLGFGFRAPSESGDWVVDPREYRSPVVAPFLGFPNSGLLTMPIFKYWQVDNLAESVTVDLAISSGDPLLIRKPSGRGWVVSILSAPEDGQASDSVESWNAITTWPSFLPLAQQLMQAVSESGSQANTKRAGEVIADRLPAFSQSSTVSLQRPDQTELSIACSQPDRIGRCEWSYSDTDMRGVYRVTKPDEAVRQFAININPQQSSLRSIDLQAIRPLLGISNVASTSKTGEAIPSHQGDSLARWLLGMLVGLLVLETSLAWLIGKRIE